METSDGSTPTVRFAARVADAARIAGYDIDSPRGGGKAALARDTGMSETTVGRMLDGKRLPDPRYYEVIARTLGLPLWDLLADAGIISAETHQSLSEIDRSRVRSPITPLEAAAELGLNDPIDREMFLGMIERLRRNKRGHADGADNTGGAAAEA